MKTNIDYMTELVADCLKTKQEKQGLRDAVADMEPDEAEMMLADYLQYHVDKDFWYLLDIKAKVDRCLSRYYSRLGINHAKIGSKYEKLGR